MLSLGIYCFDLSYNSAYLHIESLNNTILWKMVGNRNYQMKCYLLSITYISGTFWVLLHMLTHQVL